MGNTARKHPRPATCRRVLRLKEVCPHMSVPPSTDLAIVSCSIFKDELRALCAAHWPNLPLFFLDSILHMRPQQLGAELTDLLEKTQESNKRVLLLYGDCCPLMAQLEARPGVARTPGHNCCYLLLGWEQYRQLSHEGAFFLLPEWIHRWQEVFRDELGLNHENAMRFMTSMHRKLVYLDTGAIPVPTSLLEDCSAYCGLPFEVLPVSLDTLKATIEKALNELEKRESSL